VSMPDEPTRALEAWRVVGPGLDWEDVLHRAGARSKRRRAALLALGAAVLVLAAAVSPALGLVGYVQTAFRGSSDAPPILSARLTRSGLQADFRASAPRVLVVRRGGRKLAPVIFGRLGAGRRADLRMTLLWNLGIRQGEVERLSLRTSDGDRVDLCAPCAGDLPGGRHAVRVPSGFARALFGGRVTAEAATPDGTAAARVRLSLR
jgi:hypothetical protein